jgi:thiol:disulfide interchange protein
MPCVLPVIGVKIMSVVKSSGDDPRTILLQGWMYTAGIVVSFWILAGVVIALQAAGQALGQGFQFQHLPFLVFVTALIFILALSMLGVFSVGLTSGGYEKASKLSGRQGLSGAFFTGFVVTAVATPCTAPFLGAAMGFAFTQPALVTVAVFTAVGLGLAFPFTLLAHRPQWLKFLPKPGMWMEYFKQLMGFLMMGAVVWLLWVINLSQGGDAVVWTVAFLFVLGIAGWVFGTFGNAAKPRAVRRRAWVMIAVLLAGGFAGILEGQLKWRETGTADRTTGAGEEGSGRIAWVDFTPEKLDELLETDQPVFVNFTAAWCLSCKVNERTSIEIPATQSVKEQTNAVFVYGDWTNQNPEIAAFLRRHDRAGVPLYLVYGRDRDNPRLLPEILTPGTMERALRWAAETFEEDS